MKERIVTAAEAVLAEFAGGLTIEALAQQVAPRVGRPLPPAQVASSLRGAPRKFTEGTDGRWKLRPPETADLPDEDTPPAETADESSAR